MNEEEQLRKISQNVRLLLATDPECRNSDLWLTLQYWRRIQKKHVYIPYSEMDELGDFGTISRIRRKLKDLYPPTDPVVRARREKREKIMRHTMPRI